MWYVYVLVSDLDNKFYVGFTENLDNRLNLHSVLFVKRFDPLSANKIDPLNFSSSQVCS